MRRRVGVLLWLATKGSGQPAPGRGGGVLPRMRSNLSLFCGRLGSLSMIRGDSVLRHRIQKRLRLARGSGSGGRRVGRWLVLSRERFRWLEAGSARRLAARRSTLPRWESVDGMETQGRCSDKKESRCKEGAAGRDAALLRSVAQRGPSWAPGRRGGCRRRGQ
jgi:hypothetical protein